MEEGMEYMEELFLRVCVYGGVPRGSWVLSGCMAGEVAGKGQIGTKIFYVTWNRGTGPSLWWLEVGGNDLGEERDECFLRGQTITPGLSSETDKLSNHTGQASSLRGHAVPA
ncbi:hypothetical protein BgiMline_020599 [Biomphalaria glabrata]|nr:hypothetical protein BgiMline_017793 [Biomphalaria glabrata]